MRTRGPTLLFLAIVVLGGLLVGVPWATEKRPQVVSVPIPRPSATEAAVRIGQQPVCITGVELDPDADVIAVQATGTRPGPALQVDVTGPGNYSSTARVAAGYVPGQGLAIPFQAPPRELAGGQICFRATSSGTAQLLGGATDRELSSARTTIDGRPAPAQLAIALWQQPAKGLIGRIGELADRADVLRPFPFAGWVLVLLGLAVVVGVPLLVARVIGRPGRAT